MKRAWIWVLVSMAACSEAKSSGPPTSPPAPPAVARSVSRTDGILLTGLPESPALAACDSRGRWGVKTPVVEHWIIDPAEKGPLLPEENAPKVTMFRDSLPFPQTTWKAGDWEVTQLVFPVGKGFVARYHVMNHGEEGHKARLSLGARGTETPVSTAPVTLSATSIVSVTPPTRQTANEIDYDLTLQPGVSQFIHVVTADLAGKFTDDALDQATAQWEKLLGTRSVELPDSAATTAYYSDLAGQILGVSGCAEAAAKTEQMLAKKEGGALRLLADIPEKWQLEAIEVRDLPTEFGPLSFKYQGAYNNRTVELKPGCKPPEGFLLLVPEKLVARIDGKDAPHKDGTLHVPAGASYVEMSYPR